MLSVLRPDVPSNVQNTVEVLCRFSEGSAVRLVPCCNLFVFILFDSIAHSALTRATNSFIVSTDSLIDTAGYSLIT